MVNILSNVFINKAYQTAVLAMLVILSLLISGCSHPPSEEALRNKISAIQTGISERNNGDVMQHVSELFIGQPEEAKSSSFKLDRKSLRKTLTGYFLRYKQLEVVVTNMNVQVHDGVEATVSGNAVLLGMKNLIPEDGRIYKFESTWVVEDDEWKVIELKWH